MHTKPPFTLQDAKPLPAEDEINRFIYKLVRVGEDGTVLPATDDEVMRVDSLVEEDPGLRPWHADAKLKDGSGITNGDWCCRGQETTAAQVGLEDERKKMHLKLQFLDLMLEKIEEEQMRPLTLQTGCQKETEQTSNNGGLIKRRRRPNPKYFSPTMISKSDEIILSPHGYVSQSGDYEAEMSQLEGQPSQMFILSGKTAKAPKVSEEKPGKVNGNLKPRELPSLSASCNMENSVSENHIALEALTIRELQETFYRTFGKETSVKDKHWLKRQIYRGLKSSEEHSRSDSILDDNKGGLLQGLPKVALLEGESVTEQHLPSVGGILIKGKMRCTQEPFQAVDKAKQSNGFAKMDLDERQSLQDSKPVESHLDRTGPINTSNLGHVVRLEPVGKYEYGGVESADSPNSNQVHGKRLRKPNRKYIEDRDGELDFSSYGVRNTTGTRDKNQGSKFLNSGSKMLCKYPGERRMEYTTHGFSETSDATIPQRCVKGIKNDDTLYLHDNQLSQAHIARIQIMDDVSSDRASVEENSFDDFEENIARVPTANGGTRRKHHRPWTLSEVLTLIEGVAQCGGGKWADIKKLAFSAAGHRTAVDLKDKWRNLLRASRVQAQTNKQAENRKKSISAMIPAPILARVRELAALQSRVQTASIACYTDHSGCLIQSEHLLRRSNG